MVLFDEPSSITPFWPPVTLNPERVQNRASCRCRV